MSQSVDVPGQKVKRNRIQWRRTGEPCTVVENGERCVNEEHAHMMCAKHYARFRKYGDPLRFKGRGEWTRKPADERFWIMVDKNGPTPVNRPELGPCWLFTGTVDGNGYGMFRADGKNRRAHVWAYENANGQKPKGMDVDHVCHGGGACTARSECPHRRCVNPAHLEAVTRRENIHRSTGLGAVNAAKTHCPQGHEYAPENTRYQKSGGRLCRACGREYERRKKWPKPVAA